MKTIQRAAIFMLALFILVGICPMNADAQDLVTYNKVLLQTYPNAQATGNTLPIVGQNVSDFVVRTTTTGVTVTGWELVGAGTKVENRDYVLNVYVTIGVVNGVFDFFNTTGYINGEQAYVTVNADQRTAVISRTVTPLLQATVVWHHPSDETHNAGECFSFTATASQVYDSYQWMIRTTAGETYTVESLQSMFPGTYAVVGAMDQGTRCNIYNVPESFNNWRVYCVFSNAGGDVSTNAATIHIQNAAPDPTPTIVEAPDAQTANGITIVDEPTPSPTATPEVVETAEPEVNIVEWEDAWTYDETGHWHKSIDPYSDEVSETEPHVMTWTTTREAPKKEDGEEQGVCEVCGYTTTRSVAYVKPETKGLSTAAKIAIGAVAGVAVLGGGTLFVQYEIDKSKRKRRARMSGRNRKY